MKSRQLREAGFTCRGSYRRRIAESLADQARRGGYDTHLRYDYATGDTEVWERPATNGQGVRCEFTDEG